jgi:hypothetical protein
MSDSLHRLRGGRKEWATDRGMKNPKRTHPGSDSRSLRHLFRLLYQCFIRVSSVAPEHFVFQRESGGKIGCRVKCAGVVLVHSTL